MKGQVVESPRRGGGLNASLHKTVPVTNFHGTAVSLTPPKTNSCLNSQMIVTKLSSVNLKNEAYLQSDHLPHVGWFETPEVTCEWELLLRIYDALFLAH